MGFCIRKKKYADLVRYVFGGSPGVFWVFWGFRRTMGGQGVFWVFFGLKNELFFEKRAKTKIFTFTKKEFFLKNRTY